MAAFTDDQLAELKAQLGSAVDVADAQARYDRFLAAGDADSDALTATITQMLTQQIMDMAAQPAQFDVTGDYSQNTSANLTALQARLKAYQAGQEPPPVDEDDVLPYAGTVRLRQRWSRTPPRGRRRY